MGASMLAVGSAGLSLAGARAEGQAKKTAGQIEALRLKQAAEAGRVRGVQVDAAYREDLNDVESTMVAIRSSQGVAFDSPTAFALFDKAEDTNRKARQVAVSNERLKTLGLEGDAAYAYERSKSAMTSSMIKGSADMLSALSKISFGKPGG